jgi:hypothetical protein
VGNDRQLVSATQTALATGEIERSWAGTLALRKGQAEVARI